MTERFRNNGMAARPPHEAMRLAVERHRAGDLVAAARLYRSVLATWPDNFDALHWLALIEIRQGNLEAAERLLCQALQANPRSGEACANLAVVRKALGRLDEALASCDQALAIDPHHLEALYNRGVVLAALGRNEEALASYARALAIKPDFVEALNNSGGVSINLKRHELALASYGKALVINPRFTEALYNRGLALSYLGRHQEASSDFEHAFDLDRDLPFVEGMLLHARMHCGDWRSFASAAQRIVANVRRGKCSSDPLTLLAVSGSASDQRACAETWVRHKCPPTVKPLWQGERYGHERIRLAYLSADFREHPIAHLTAELMARHDRQRFETIALSFGSGAHDPMRERIIRGVDRFIDVAHASDREIAEMMRSLEVDIAIDLMGFTADARTGVLALRAAPIQVNYLGLPATMGASYIDYILADAHVIPREHAHHYTEQVVHLPDTFQAVDATRPLSQAKTSRGEAGLPEHALVFCCFNNVYKMSPIVFDVWMRILKDVDGSILWLIGESAVAASHLREEANACGVDPTRLIFAPRVSYAEHLARLPLADLFLDTLPFNAGATAADALWSGLPVLTVSGEAFAARMAGSLLHAAGLPELVTGSLDAYRAMALRLAGDPALLQATRQKLVSYRTCMPLFDSERFRRNIEAAYVTMWARYERGEVAEGFALQGPA